ncbi:MAG TPA: ribonuclease activity regulator RraA [Burkholderiaceae bacterium]|nr:ribonuclease activity regulator RraA [Burkholderiaceae bacterium]
MTDTTQLCARLSAIPTGTLATILRQRGLHHVWMDGPVPLQPGQRPIAGPAFTLRYVPAREDMTTAESLAGPVSSRKAVETMNEGCVVVADAMGLRRAGVMGDILCARMQFRKVAGLVTDGAVRDRGALRDLGFPVWAQGAAAPPSLSALHYVEAQTVVGCGGVAVWPGDLIVADEDGAIVIPRALAADVCAQAGDKEAFERWVLDQVRGGASLDGLYPPSARTKARFEEEKR